MITTRCSRPSPEATETCTATNAGADTLCGLSESSEPIVNVAGTRALVAPPAGAEEVVGGAGPDPEDVVRGAVVVVLAGAVTVAVVPPDVGPVAVVGAAVVATAAALVIVELLDECVELPHPARSAIAHIVASSRTERLMRRA